MADTEIMSQPPTGEVKKVKKVVKKKKKVTIDESSVEGSRRESTSESQTIIDGESNGAQFAESTETVTSTAMSKDFQPGDVFNCWNCDESLIGHKYVLREDHAYCVKCYEARFCNTCTGCEKLIDIDSKDLAYQDKHWHEACFICETCNKSLVDQAFGSKGEPIRIFCADCYDQQFSARCDGCGDIFRAGTKKMEYKGQQWHENCFCCSNCKEPIGTRSFIPRDPEHYCVNCYEQIFGTRCVKCDQLIVATGGVTYKGQPWHRECFTCTGCNNSLADTRFTLRDDQPYCGECYAQRFAKRCAGCDQPIMGGGTRFVTFEDKNWHNDCFVCADCRGSLVGKGFLNDGPDVIICTECAKNRLLSI